MRNKLTQFMAGRYGVDQLYRFLLMTGVVCLLLGSLLDEIPLVGLLCTAASWALLLFALFRVFSRNTQKRYLENLHYLEWWGARRRQVNMTREKFRQRKDFKFFVCPTCKTNLRVPKGKGKVNITCSKCGTRFKGKT